MNKNNNNQPENTVIFLHIPRTAGVTLDAILERQYKLDRFFSLYSPEDVDKFKKISPEDKQKIDLLNGHFMSCGVHELLPQPCTYITIMRNPIDRIISHYYFVRRSRSHYLHEEILSREMSLKDYVSSEISIEVNNGQTRLIAGWKENPGIGIGKCPPEMLETAKKNIEEHFAVVGLTEEFDKTLVLFKQALGWTETFYTKRNQTKNRKAVKEVPQEIIKIIESYNDLDLELYKFAQTRFQETIERQGDVFERELQKFLSLNEKYGSIYTWLGLVVNKVRKSFLK